MKTKTILPMAMIFVALITNGCLSDIRPKYMSENQITQADKEKGKRLLTELAQTYGGLDNWRAQKSARAILTDDWPVLMMRLMASPWYKNKQKVALSWLISTDNSRLEFLEAPNKALEWGIQNWSMWHKQANGKMVFNKSETIKFWLPTMQYFVEAPFRLLDADLITYAGENTSMGQNYDLVFVSWGKAEPQKKIDQYIVWINKSTKKMDILEYTVRDMMPFLTGTMIYEDFKVTNGLTFAHKMTVVDGHENRDKIVHQMLMKDLVLGIGKPTSYFIPQPQRVSKK